MKIMKQHFPCSRAALVVLAVALSCTAADRASSGKQQKQTNLGLSEKAQHPAGLQSTQDLPRLGALKGSGGGLKVLEHNQREGADKSIYRTWDHRFELQPYDLDDPDFLKPENRMGYRRFYAGNPNLALAPNSRDRKAQSTVELMFGLTALGSIVCGVIMIHAMSVLDTENLTLLQYQDLMTRVVILAALPWLALGIWLFTVSAEGVVNPMRDPKMVYNWQCSSMAGFLLVAPMINTAYFAVHALWLSRLFFKLDRQISAPMGRMFLLTPEMEKLASSDWLTHILNVATDPTIRYMLLFLEFGVALFGYMLITFRWGANSQFCQPEVYWATTALVVTVAIIIVFTFLTFLGCLFIGVFSISPWVQDFVRSFKDARLMAKISKHEEQERAADAAARREAAETNYEAEFNAWAADYDQDIQEQNQRHQEILDGHVRYLEGVRQEAARFEEDMNKPQQPQQQQQQPVQLRQHITIPVRQQEIDNSLQPPSNITLLQPPTSASAPIPPTNFTLFDPPTSFAQGEFSVRPLNPDRVFQAAEGWKVHSTPVGGNNAGSLYGSTPDLPWSAQGFAKPFGQR